MIIFYKTLSIEPVADKLADSLAEHLGKGLSALWLVPGGSGIEIASMAARNLRALNVDLSKLTVSLSDERYGPVGHPDSNWLQLQKAGFKLPGARLSPVLAGLSLEATAAAYSSFLEQALRLATYKLAFLGMGADGHIAGIKPGSPAVDSHKLAAGYEWEDFTRLTMTPLAIKRADEVVCWAAGSAKRGALESLDDELPLEVEPAQILKAVSSVTVYNDIRGEEI